MRTDAVHVGGLCGFAALGVSAAAVVFERASTAVITADPAEYTGWVTTYHSELLTQSLLFVASSGLLLVLFGGVRALVQVSPGLSQAVLAAGAVWVGMSLSAQAVQVTMARAAFVGAAPDVVAVLGGLMTVLLLVANLPLVIVLVAVALAGLREHLLPTWLGWVSAVAALLHLVPLLGLPVTDGPMSPGGIVGYLPYPAFVVWLAAVSLVMLRTPARAHGRTPVAATASTTKASSA